MEFGYSFDKPKFTEDEYRKRLEKVRFGMQEEGVETLILFSPNNLYYLVGYNTIGIENFQAFIIPLEGQPILFIRELERGVAEATCWIDRFEIWQDHEDPIDKMFDVIRCNRLFNKHIAIEKGSLFFTVNLYEKLLQKLGYNPLNGSNIIHQVRAIKSDQEIKYIRKAAAITRVGIDAAMHSLAEGKSENEVVADLLGAMIKEGSEKPAGGPILTAGYKSGIAHSSWHRYVMQRGDVVLIEISGCWNRYSAPMMRTAAICNAPVMATKMMQVCKGALEAAIEAIKPGVTSGYVDEQCRKVIEKAGYESMFRKRTGYSVGVGFPPSWGEGEIIDLKKDDQRLLEPGMVFHIPPALRDYRKVGVGVSETVLVTDKGSEVITDYSRDLFIIEK